MAAGTPAPTTPAEAAATPDEDPGRGAEEPPALSEAAARDLAMVSEARRLFGKQGAAYEGDGAAGPRSRPGLPAWVQPGVGTCVVEGRTVATAAARSNGYVEGIVRSSETGNPLPGAFMQILGTGTAASKGLRHGYIVDIKEAAQSVREAVARAAGASRIKVARARVAVGGVGLEDLRSTGELSLTPSGGVVTEHDIVLRGLCASCS